MKVLIACEYSGITREAFRVKGHDAWSCDLLPTEIPGNHLVGDAVEYSRSREWDIVIAHPPCKFLSSSGYHWVGVNNSRVFKVLEAAKFFMDLYLCGAKKVCVENPTGIMSSIFREPDQIVHPFFFGEPEMKRTCFWLRGLPKLIHIPIDDLFSQATHVKKPDSVYIDKSGKNRYFTDSFPETLDREHNRRRSFQSIAKAMADQWG